MKFDFFIILMNTSDVIRLHDLAIERFGGKPGIMDMGLLESAINQPIMMIYFGADKDREIYYLGAAYFRWE